MTMLAAYPALRAAGWSGAYVHEAWADLLLVVGSAAIAGKILGIAAVLAARQVADRLRRAVPDT